MANVWYYRNESKVARERAAASSDPIAIQTWLRIAEDYDRLADSVEAAERSGGFGPAPMKPQPQRMQQQQSKTEGDDKK